LILVQFLGPLPSIVTLNAGGIFGVSRGSARALQSGQGIPGAPHVQARGWSGVLQSEGRSSWLADPERVVTSPALGLIPIASP
jgi:hypothetical protein